MNSAKKRANYLWDLYDFLEIFVICSAAVILVFSFLGRLTIVDGESMEDTLHDGDFLLIENIFYEPKQGDIVVIHDTSNVGLYAEPLVKRVIAVAGQTVDFDAATNTVAVDGEVIDEPYVKLTGNPITSGVHFPLTVPENEVFVMGDNRNHSGDSRAFGTVDKRCIVGKAFLRIFPLESFGSPYSRETDSAAN